jgi:lipopolysaccharide export system protein LptC
MAVELHLPDLPEIPISLGPVHGSGPRALVPWHLRVQDALSAYLPLLLMLLLALGTWWLVKNTPTSPAASAPRAARHEPDYAMTQFSMERFAADGSLRLRLEGAQMRHFPDTDRIEIEGVRMRAVAPDGRVTLAQAQRAISNGDGSEVQLVGAAEVTSGDGTAAALLMRSEFLHAYVVTERVRTHLPVLVQRGATELRAGGLDYDHGQQRLELAGPIRAVLPARTRAAAP